MKTMELSREVLAPKSQPLKVLPPVDGALLDHPFAAEQLAAFPSQFDTAPLPAPVQSHSVVHFLVQWVGISAFCAAVLWPVSEWRTNYTFKSLPQYLHQEYVWWVKTTR